MRTEVKGRHADLDRLVAYVVGSLSRHERDRVGAHLARCAECHKIVWDYLEVGLAIGASAPRRVPPARLRARVLGEVAGERGATPGGWWKWPRLAPARLRVATAAVLAVVLPLVLVLGIGVVAPTPAFAASTTLTIISGSVEVAEGAQVAWAAAEDGMTLSVGYRVRTGHDGHAVLTFFDGSTLTLEPRTNVTVEELAATDDGRVIAVFQALGRTWSSVKRLTSSASRYEVRTPTSTAAVRGTGFETEVLENGDTTVTTNDGSVAVIGRDAATGRAEEVVVTAGQRTTVRRDERPAQPSPAPARPRVSFTSNASFLVVGPAGLTCGRTQQGDVVRQARCVVEADSVTVAGLGAGAYQVVVQATVDGTVTVRAIGFLGDAVTFERVATVALRAGEQAVAGLGVKTRGDGAYEADEFAPFTKTERSPAKIVAKKKQEEGGDAKRDRKPAGGGATPEPRREPERARTPDADRTRAPDATREPRRTAEPQRTREKEATGPGGALPPGGPSFEADRTPEPRRTLEPPRTREPERTAEPDRRGRDESRTPEPRETPRSRSGQESPQIAVPRVDLPRLPRPVPSPAPKVEPVRIETPKPEKTRAPETERVRTPEPRRESTPRPVETPRLETPRPETPRLETPRP